ncbi:MAG: NADH-quinone oxidoreductase subunit L [Acidilobaceae archaeon]
MSGAYDPLMPWTLAWLAPYIGALAIAIGWFLKVRSEKFYGYTSVLSILASSLISTYAAYTVFTRGKPLYSGGDVVWVPWLNITLGTYFDGLSALMSLTVSWISLMIAVYSVKYMEGDWGYGRYFFFFTFFVGSMMLLVLADNLVLMFIGWEGTGLCSYALIGHWYTDEEDKWVGRPGRRVLGTPMFFEPSHSGVRAMLFTRIGDLGFILGIAILYVTAGTFNIVELASGAPAWMQTLASKGILTPLLLIFILGALAKSAQFPFHEWLATAMTGPTPVSALIHAATMVKAGIYLFLRITPILFTGALALKASPEVFSLVVSQLEQFFIIIALAGALTAFMLATMALVSDELKLILAYSTASQIGYMFLAAASAGLLVYSGAIEALVEGIVAGFSHLMSHAVFKAALFLIAGWLIHLAHSRFIDQMGGYSAIKLTAVALWFSGLSLSGIPPFSGFFSKEAVIHTALTANTLLGLAAIVTAGLTAAYTVRVIVRVLHMPPYSGHGKHKVEEAPLTMLAPYLLLALASLAIGLLWPSMASIYSRMGALTLSIGELVHVEALVISGSMVLTILVVAASIAAIFLLYLVFKVNFPALLGRGGLYGALYNFLYDRWYINPLIYLGFVNGGVRAVRGVGEVDDSIDLLYHSAMPSTGSLSAWSLRALHRGRTDYYLALYILSALLMLFLVLALMR